MKKRHPEDRLLHIIRAADPFPKSADASINRSPEPPPARVEAAPADAGTPLPPTPNRIRYLLWALPFLLLPVVYFFVTGNAPRDTESPVAAPPAVTDQGMPRGEGTAHRGAVLPPDQLSVIGIIDGQYPQAIILHAGSGQTSTVQVGDSVDHFQVTRISGGQVSFTSQGETFTLTF